MSDNEAFPSALKLQRIFQPWRLSKLFLLPDLLAFSVLTHESYLLNTLYSVVFGIFNILATCPYEWPTLINSTMESLSPTDKSLIFPAFYFQLFIYVLDTETLINY